MALSAENDMKVEQLDIANAYLNGTVDEEIFMEKPEYLVEMLDT